MNTEHRKNDASLRVLMKDQENMYPRKITHVKPRRIIYENLI